MTAAAAIHEAGHVWAYHAHRLPIRYVTLRPRNNGLCTGMVALWRGRRIDPFVAGWIASAGPIAEAIHTIRTDPAADSDWDDHLRGAVLAGGHDDLQRSGGLLDNPGVVAFIRGGVERDWGAITALAHLLGVRKTVGGPEAFNRLADSQRTSRLG